MENAKNLHHISLYSVEEHIGVGQNATHVACNFGSCSPHLGKLREELDPFLKQSSIAFGDRRIFPIEFLKNRFEVRLRLRGTLDLSH